MSHIDKVKQFFEQWQLYQRIIFHNYMAHKEISNILETYLSPYASQAIAFLDLGCGDASIIANILAKYPPITYTGIDLSDMALSYAKQNMEMTPCAKTFIQGDFLSALASQTHRYTVILCGYALHHLTREQKNSCFASLKKLLHPNGRFFLYDLVHEDDESAADYIGRMHGAVYKHMQQLSEKEKDQVWKHISHQDHPENDAYFHAIAKKEGFVSCQRVFRDTENLYSFYVLTA